VLKRIQHRLSFVAVWKYDLQSRSNLVSLFGADRHVGGLSGKTK
jgi:hypothetical protein